MEKTIEIPEGYEARIEGNKVILEPNDESIRNFLYEFIKICGWSEKNFPPRERCLAYLERQGQQKPAEWSEEDKLHLNNAILVAKKEWGVNSYTARWLESLRDNYKKCNSHWKPSEEQMDALKVSSEYEPCIKNREYLKSLYADLKKL